MAVKSKKKVLKKAAKQLAIVVTLFILMSCFSSVYHIYDWLFQKVISPVLCILQRITGQKLYVILLMIIVIRIAVLFARKPIKMAGVLIVSGALKIAVAFFVLWGFHYSQPSLEVKENLTNSEVIKLLEASVESLDQYSLNEEVSLKKRSFLIEPELKQKIDSQLIIEANQLNTRATTFNYPSAVISDGFLRKMGISGIYFPFTGEPLYDGSSPLLRKAFTYAHEFFHGIGVTGEDECNYLAWKTLKATGHDFLIYAADLDVFLTCASLLSVDIESIPNLPKGVVNDINFLRADSEMYKTWFHHVSHYSNNAYLKVLSSSEGVSAYNSYVKWIGN